jgi:hypothetical protein
MRATVILRMAGVYNLAYGLLLAFWPVQVFHWLGMPQTPSIMIQAIGMMVGVYGLAYWIAGDDPVRYWPLVAVGLLGKILGPVGFSAGLLQGVFVWKSATMFVFNDLIWWWPLGKVLLRAWRNGPHAVRRPIEGPMK